MKKEISDKIDLGKVSRLARKFVDDFMRYSFQDRIIIEGRSKEVPFIIEEMKKYSNEVGENVDILQGDREGNKGYSVDADYYINI